MALITCPECENTVSDQAKECPHCGYPLDRMETTDPYAYAQESFQPESISVEEQKLRSYGLYSFILAIVSLFLPIPILDAIIGVIAVIMAVFGLKASKRGFAIAGLVIGIIAVVGALTLVATGEYFEMFEF